jgi:hypothetical protein
MARTYRRKHRYLEIQFIGFEEEQIYYKWDIQKFGNTEDRGLLYKRTLHRFHTDSYKTKMENPFLYIPNKISHRLRRAYLIEIKRCISLDEIENFTRPIIKSDERYDWFRPKFHRASLRPGNRIQVK